MKEYRIDLKIRNNLFLKKIEEKGYQSISELCDKNNIKDKTLLYNIASMKKSPLNNKGEFHQSIYKLCEILTCSPEELFSENQLYLEIKNNKRSLEISEAEAKFYLENYKDEESTEQKYIDNKILELTEEMLKSLTPREEKVIKMRFYENMTLEEISKEFNVNRERIRQIQERALRKMRHPSRSQDIGKLLNIYE